MKNKQTIWVLLVLISSSMVLASEGQANHVNTQSQQEYRVQTNIVGLDNAMARVRTQEQQQKIEQVANRIQERWRERLQRMGQVEFSENLQGNVEVKGKTEGKFLGMFRAQKTNRYYVTEEGELIYRKGWADFLWVDFEE